MNMGGLWQELLNQHPLLIAFDILALIAAVGCIIVLMRETVLFRGYRDLKRVAKGIAKSLDATVFRDGTDLVISGFHRGIPAVIRFSFAENTPEVDIWMKMSSALNLFVTHKSMKSTEGRMRVPTRDSWFDDRFVIRTDNPNDAVALLTDDRAFGELKKLCCSPGTAVALGRESLEMSEQTLPQPNPYKHILDHLDSLAEIAVRVGAISNLPKSKVAKIYVPDRYVVARLALAVLVIMGLWEVVSAARHFGSQNAVPKADGPIASTTSLTDQEQAHLPGMGEWRLATADDFDPSTVAWLHDRGKEVSARFVTNLDGSEKTLDTGYIFVNKDAAQPNPWRIAMLSQGRDIFDSRFSGVLAVVPIKKDVIAGLTWQDQGPTTTSPDGDGFMILRSEGDEKRAAVIYLSEGKVQNRVPTDYRNVELR